MSYSSSQNFKMKLLLLVFAAVVQITTSEIRVEPVTEPTYFGNQPFWDTKSQALYYTDMFTSTAHKYIPSTRTHTSVKIANEGHVFMFVPRELGKNQFFTTLESKILIVEWDGVSDSLKHVEEVFDEGIKGNSWSDGAENENGNYWIGSYQNVEFSSKTFGESVGSLYSINSTRHVTKHLENTTVTSAIVWSPDNKKMFYVDASTYKVEVFDFNADANTISNRRTLLDVRDLNLNKYYKEEMQVPGFVTMDTGGNLWVSVYNGGCVLKVDPDTGKVLQTIDIPTVPMLDGITFGGPNLDELFITSSIIALPEDLKKQYPDSGKVLKITGLGVKGIPALRSVV